MHFIKKQRNKLLYKKLLPLKKNIQNKDKLFKLRKKKWQKFLHSLSKLKKPKFYDPISHFLYNFNNFFSRKFKYNLENKQRLSYFYGSLKKSYLKRLVKLTLNEFKRNNTHATTLFIEKLESRLDTALYRTYFSYSFNNARQLISHKKVYINNNVVQHNSFRLKKGDLITFDKDIFNYVSSIISKSKIWALPPKHFHINYKTFQILVIEDIKYTNCLRYYPF